MAAVIGLQVQGSRYRTSAGLQVQVKCRAARLQVQSSRFMAAGAGLHVQGYRYRAAGA